MQAVLGADPRAEAMLLEGQAVRVVVACLAGFARKSQHTIQAALMEARQVAIELRRFPMEAAAALAVVELAPSNDCSQRSAHITDHEEVAAELAAAGATHTHQPIEAVAQLVVDTARTPHQYRMLLQQSHTQHQFRAIQALSFRALMEATRLRWFNRFP